MGDIFIQCLDKREYGLFIIGFNFEMDILHNPHLNEEEKKSNLIRAFGKCESVLADLHEIDYPKRAIYIHGNKFEQTYLRKIQSFLRSFKPEEWSGDDIDFFVFVSGKKCDGKEINLYYWPI
jgi:hypothetical protein